VGVNFKISVKQCVKKEMNELSKESQGKSRGKRRTLQARCSKENPQKR
jgi:rRNA-processing protein FCF1